MSLRDYSVSTILIQNDHDPVTSARNIRKEQVNGRFKNITLVEVKGDDHVYGDFNEIKNYFVKSQGKRIFITTLAPLSLPSDSIEKLP